MFSVVRVGQTIQTLKKKMGEKSGGRLRWTLTTGDIRGEHLPVSEMGGPTAKTG